jgi:c-di-GMP-related signal transduction protein
MSTTELVIARQPIFTAEREIMGYELLYRSVAVAPAALTGDQMTAHVLLGAGSIGIEQLVGDKYIFCNADRGMLVGDYEIALPSERTVVEVLETVQPDQEVLRGCQRLVRAGYQLALDDFVWFDGAEDLLGLASIVKLDVLHTDRRQLRQLAVTCRRYGVRLLAEKVETEDDIAFCRALGFELFQGFALQRPQSVRGREIVSSQLGRVELAATVLSEDLDLRQFEQVLAHEPGLAVHLLQLASIGTRFGVRRAVRSVREALVLLGTVRLHRWLALLLLRDAGDIAPDAMSTTLVRARMCELLASRRGIGTAELAFTAALISCIDILTGASTEQIAELTLAPELRAAAVEFATPLGELVAEVIAHQRGCGDPLPAQPSDLDLAAAEALSWALPYVHSLDPDASPAGLPGG